MTRTAAVGDRFTYDGYELDRRDCRLLCRYSLGRHRFTEEIGFGGSASAAGTGGTASADGGASGRLDAAARLVCLLAGVSYYKTAAPPVVDLGPLPTTEPERRFLRSFYLDGLAEFTYRNRLDLSGLRIEGPDRDADGAGAGVAGGPGDRRGPGEAGGAGRPLVPFGGGIDSIVTAECIRRRHPAATLFVVSRAGDRFEAIERAAAVTGLPVVRAERRIDAAVLRSSTLGFLNGHVPVTGILSAIAVLAAVAGDRDAVVMSNERSASAGALEAGGRTVNHQWSKSAEFEAGFRRLLGATIGPGLEYFSYLRSRSELWVARRFASLTRYHDVFRSCNRAFHIDPARRLDAWCGRCDKCCFIDLVLAPFLGPAELAAIFGGREPLADPSLMPQYRALLGTGPDPRPFECVGDEEECRTAIAAAAARDDRAGFGPLQTLAAEVAAAAAGGPPVTDLAALLAPAGPDFVPSRYADPPVPVGAGT